MIKTTIVSGRELERRLGSEYRRRALELAELFPAPGGLRSGGLARLGGPQDPAQRSPTDLPDPIPPAPPPVNPYQDGGTPDPVEPAPPPRPAEPDPKPAPVRRKVGGGGPGGR